MSGIDRIRQHYEKPAEKVPMTTRQRSHHEEKAMYLGNPGMAELDDLAARAKADPRIEASLSPGQRMMLGYRDEALASRKILDEEDR